MSKIQDIITKSILEEASSDELLLLDDWRNESTQNENLYQEYKTIWNASADYTPTNFQPNSESAYKKHIEILASENDYVVQLTAEKPVQENKINQDSSNQINTSRSTKLFSLRRVASIAALFVLAFGAMIVFNAMNNTTISSENGVTYASLEDGTSIWLDEGSSVSYSNGFGKDHREMKLVGKAFFDVQRNENVPFNISSNDMDVSVLGTSFTVDTKGSNHIVSVKTGIVAVKTDKKEVTLTADEKVSFENNEFIHHTASLEDVAWRNSNLSFNNAPLDQVIADINLFHENKIVLNNDIKNLDCPFTARSLSKTSFKNIIEILKATYDLKTEDLQNGTVSLTISDCK